MQLGSVIGVPSFSGGGNIGLGFSLTLIDRFTGPSRAIEKRFGALSKTIDRYTALIGRRMDAMNAALGVAAGGGAALAALSFPLRQAAKFQDEMIGIFNLVDDKTATSQRQGAASDRPIVLKVDGRILAKSQDKVRRLRGQLGSN